jgi:hypothetical protein
LKLDVDKFIELMMQIFLITTILSTWFLPIHRDISQNALSSVLLTYTAAGADISEFFSTINANHVKTNAALVNGIISKTNENFLPAFLSVFFLVCSIISSIQFSLVLTSTRPNDENNKTILDYIIGNESWSILLICLTQDLPFFIIRLYVMIRYFDFYDPNYTKYFFLLKSFVLIILEIYRFIILVHEGNFKKKISNCDSTSKIIDYN